MLPPRITIVAAIALLLSGSMRDAQGAVDDYTSLDCTPLEAWIEVETQWLFTIVPFRDDLLTIDELIQELDGNTYLGRTEATLALIEEFSSWVDGKSCECHMFILEDISRRLRLDSGISLEVKQRIEYIIKILFREWEESCPKPPPIDLLSPFGTLPSTQPKPPLTIPEMLLLQQQLQDAP